MVLIPCYKEKSTKSLEFCVGDLWSVVMLSITKRWWVTRQIIYVDCVMHLENGRVRDAGRKSKKSKGSKSRR